jgi:tyrocidine synthetase-3
MQHIDQVMLLSTRAYQQKKAYWLQKLAGYYTGTYLFPDVPGVGHYFVVDNRVEYQLAKGLREKLSKFCKDSELLLFVFLLTVLKSLMYRYTGNHDIVVWAPVYDRDFKEDGLNHVVAIRDMVEGRLSFKDLLKQVRKTVMEAFENQEYPIDRIIELLDGRNERHRLECDVVMALKGFQHADVVHTFHNNLVFLFEPRGEGIGVEVMFDPEKYRPGTLENFIRHYELILETVVEHIDVSIKEIPLLLKEEQETLLLLNRTSACYPADKTIPELFESRAERSPYHRAVVCEDHNLTYGELNGAANRLARLLREKGVTGETIAAVMLERSIEMVVGLLGILKAGGAYLPIDPEFPVQRIRYMLQDSLAGYIVTRPALAASLHFDNEVIFVDDRQQNSKDSGNLERTAFPGSLASIFYTSGSTGRPKGVMVAHRNIVNLIHWFSRYYDLNKNRNVLLLTNYIFDASVDQIFAPLLNGGVLFCAKKETILNGSEFSKYVRAHTINVINATPSLLKELLSGAGKMPSLHIVISGGEMLDDNLKDTLLAQGYELYNHYGPTETTVDAVVSRCSQEKRVTIGKPIANTGAFILGEADQVQPIGSVGELCIGGDGLTRGYLNNPELTIQKYTVTAALGGKFLFKTGDLARWSVDGELEYLGRKDRQVKIRGFRIELEEIERHLLEMAVVKESVVTVREDTTGDRYLCAYIVGDKRGDHVSVDDLKYRLLRRLPGYMIPSEFIVLEKMPLLPGGKIDRKALPQPQEREEEALSGIPTSGLERKLVEIWTEILGKERIGVNDNFFDLGGHSLKATQLVARIYKEFNVELELTEVFVSSTIKKLADIIGKDPAVRQFSPIEVQPKKEYYHLSSAQKRLYILQQMAAQGTHYNMPHQIPFRTAFNKERLEWAFKELIVRHESLRTSFEILGDGPIQRVHRSVDFSIEYYEIGKDEVEQVFKEFIRPFDLSRPPLLRVAFVTMTAMDHLLFLDMHHIITDGTSQDILKREFYALYRGEELPRLRLQYKDFSEWQNSRRQEEALKRQEDYWLGEFPGEVPVLNLPTDYDRPLIQGFEGAYINFVLAEPEMQALKETSKEVDLTFYMCILTVLNVLLAKLTGQEDIVIGTPVANRRHADLEGIIGMFVNTLALRNFPAADKTLRDFLIEVKERTLKAFENQEYPFESLVDNVSDNRDASRNPVFDVMLSLGNHPEYTDDFLAITDPKLSRHIEYTSKFDLDLAVINYKERFFFHLEYCTRLFKPGTIDRFIVYFKRIFSLLTVHIDRKLSDIEIVAGKERDAILTLSSGPQALDGVERMIQQMFEEKAAAHPETVALVFGDQRLTYGELNRRANRLGRCLRQRGVGPDVIVGLMAERSFEMIIGVLAILKAGGAYLPVDLDYPGERIGYMLKDSQVRLLLSHHEGEGLTAHMPPGMEVIDIKFHDDRVVGEDGVNLGLSHRGRDLVYVIYTSGSTGKPKGVMLEHRNVVNLITFDHRYTTINCRKILQFHSIGFDASFHEIFCALLGGGTLYLIDRDTQADISELLMVVEKNEIMTLFLPMSFLKVLFSDPAYIRAIPGCVTHIQTGGEQVVISTHFRDYLRKNGVYFHNHYGPSETHVVTALTIHPEEENIAELPTIGKPILNTRVYIVDRSGHPLPVGVTGELCIGGVQVGRGYVGRGELTEERFILDPFGREGRLYKSGDLARWLPDGNIEFLGRLDSQVKIRGFRVEPGEIESQLLSCDTIKEAVVIPRNEGGEPYLCAYIVAEGEVTTASLREHLSTALPGYMIPSYFVPLERIPVTVNGKVDRRALPPPHGLQGAGYRAPVDHVEARLLEMWAEVLGMDMDAIGTDSNFFQLGGHSLKATILIARIHKVFNVKITLGEMFRQPTVSHLSGLVRAARTFYYQPIQPAEQKKYYALSPAQRRLYILWQMEPHTTAYNMPEVLALKGEVDGGRLEGIFRDLVLRHEGLRTSFLEIDGKPVQKIHRAVDFEIEYYDPGPSQKAKKVIDLFIRPFHLGRPPLIRAGVAGLGEGKSILMVDLHHIVSDGISRAVLIGEFMARYNDEPLPRLRLRYIDFVEWYYSQQEQGLRLQENYWLEQFRGKLPLLNLPVDYRRPSSQDFNGRRLYFRLGQDDTGRLKALAVSEGVSLFILLLTIYYVFLYRETGQQDIIVGTYTAGRRHDDLKNIIGMFLNTLALRNFPAKEKTFKGFLAEVNSRTLAAFENQDYPFERLVERKMGNKDLGRNPLFDVVFALNNINEPEVEIPGLKFAAFEYEFRISKFDLHWIAWEEGEELLFTVTYKTSLFKPETLEWFIRDFKRITASILNKPDVKLAEMELIDGAEKDEILAHLTEDLEED